MQLKEAIDWLKNNDPATLGINRKEHSDGRVIYNYDQIASHYNRFNPVVRWCRSLVLDRDFNLVCRGFYRFFNYGECKEDCDAFNWNSFAASSKEDGSYLAAYRYNGQLCFNMRNSFLEDGPSPGITWKEICDEAINSKLLHAATQNHALIFELCSPYNKIVRQYPYPTIFLLNVFYGDRELATLFECDTLFSLLFKRPQQYHFSSIEEVSQALTKLAVDDPTFEGFVLRDSNGVRFKIKSESYLRLHKVWNNGAVLSLNRIVPLVLNNMRGDVQQLDRVLNEYDRVYNAIEELKAFLDQSFVTHCTLSRKEFAVKVQKLPISCVLFACKTRYDAGEYVRPSSILYNYEKQIIGYLSNE